MTALLTVTGDVVRLLARTSGLDLEAGRAEALVPAVRSILVGDARLAALDLHVTPAAGPEWPEVRRE